MSKTKLIRPAEAAAPLPATVPASPISEEVAPVAETREPLYWAIAAEGHPPAIMADVATDARRADRARLGLEPAHAILEIADDPVPLYSYPREDAAKDAALQIFDTQAAAQKICTKRRSEGKDIATKTLLSRKQQAADFAERERVRAENLKLSLRERIRARLVEEAKQKAKLADAIERQVAVARADADSAFRTIDARVEEEAKRIDGLPTIKRIVDDIKSSQPSFPDSLEAAVSISRRHGVAP